MKRNSMEVGSSNRKRCAHRKSRLGCFACKARRTKCNEALPTCKLCQRHGTRCVYPRSKTNEHHTKALSCQQLLPAPPTRTTLELCYLQHFLTIATPFLPLGNEQVWITRVPQLANQNSNVMSAMLGLSAAHLGCVSKSQSHKTQAIIYRSQSLSALKSSLSSTNWTHSEVDSAIALVYLLLFQSQFMEDGLFDFMTMSRGSVLLSKYFVQSGHKTMFDLVPTATGPSVPESVIGGLPILDVHCIEKGLSALNLLFPELQTDEQTKLFLSIQAVFQACLTSTLNGFETFWSALDYRFPTTFASSDNVIKVLQAFLIALRLFMGPVTQYVFCTPQKQYNILKDSRLVTIDWALKIFRSLPPQMRTHTKWPEAIVEQALLKSNILIPKHQIVTTVPRQL